MTRAGSTRIVPLVRGLQCRVFTAGAHDPLCLMNGSHGTHIVPSTDPPFDPAQASGLGPGFYERRRLLLTLPLLASLLYHWWGWLPILAGICRPDRCHDRGICCNLTHRVHINDRRRCSSMRVLFVGQCFDWLRYCIAPAVSGVRLLRLGVGRWSPGII